MVFCSFHGFLNESRYAKSLIGDADARRARGRRARVVLAVTLRDVRAAGTPLKPTAAKRRSSSALPTIST